MKLASLCFIGYIYLIGSLDIATGSILGASGIRMSSHKFEQESKNTEKDLNLRPIIGIMTQKLTFVPDSPQADLLKHSVTDSSEYIASSYVKFVEAAGARVVAIRFNQSKEDLRRLFGKLNGVLLPGGAVSLVPGTPYYTAGEVLYEYALEHDLPILGICLGFEWLSALAAGTHGVLDDSGVFNASNQAYNISLTRHGRTSRLFQHIMKDYYVLEALEKKNITFNEHELGITPKVFQREAKLHEHYNMLATSTDSNGKDFVAAFEHKHRDIFGVQFHPEKNLFEWFYKGNFPHTPEAIRFSQTLANTFIEKARTNKNSFGLSPVEEAKVLIQNHQNDFLGGESYFMEIYSFMKHEPQLGLSPQRPQKQKADEFTQILN